MERPAPEAAARHLVAIIASSDDAIISKDLNGTVLSWNAAAERVFGFMAAEMIGQSIMRLIPPDRRDEEQRVLATVRHGEAVGPFETVRRRKDGTLIPISLTVSPIRDERNIVVGASKIARDISDRKHADALLARVQAEGADLQRRLLALLAASRSLVGTTSVEAVLTSAIALARELVVADGYVVWRRHDHDPYWQPVRVAGVSSEFAAPIADWPDMDRLAPAALSEPWIVTDVFAEPGLQPRFDAYRREGIVSMLVIPLRIREVVSGTLAFYHRRSHTFAETELQAAIALANLVASGVTMAELYEQERAAREEARQANRVKDSFLATLSHELRTPLNAILGYTHMLQQDALGQSRRDHALRVIGRNASALRQIVGDILDVSRIVSGKLSLQVELTDVAQLLNEAIDTVVPDAEAKGVRVDRHIESTLPLHVDSNRLLQAIWNLLSNAIKFTPPGGAVMVELTRSGNTAAIRVTDTGIGISGSMLNTIFEPFRQADSRPTREFGGLGLGLAITRRLVELHGGTVTARSEGHGQGATFELTLPILVQAAAGEACEKPNP